jgi:hypothetical protein
MQQTSKLKLNKETGQIEGEWEDVLAGYLDNQSKSYELPE